MLVGIPGDLVELYDQLGNWGPTADAQNQQPSTSQTTGEQAQGSQGSSNNGKNAAGTSTQEQQQPASPAANLSENTEQMRIGEARNNAAGVQDESLLMDLDAENAGWTILNVCEF